MTNLLKTLRKHRIAIILAILASIIVSSPQIAFRYEHKDDGVYQGIELMPDSFWSPRVREVQDGHLNFGSMYWKDGKDNPYLFQPLGSIIVAYMGKIFSFDINNTLLLSRFVLTFASFLLIYSFVFLLFNGKGAALSSAAVIVFADAFLEPSGVAKFLSGESPSDFLIIGQPVVPATIYLLLFGFLISFWLFYKKGRWYYGVLSAVLLGLNFYHYFYSWTYLFAFGGILGLLLLFRRKWKDAAKVASVYLGSLAVAIPYLINLHRVSIHPLYEAVSMRIGIIETHAPLFVGIVVIGSIIVFFWGYPKEDKRNYIFSMALLLAPFVTLNQQLLTGKIMQAGHYHWYFHKPIAVILVFIVLFSVLHSRKLFLYKRGLATLVVAGSIAFGIFVQVDSYHNSKVYGESISIERQKYGPAMTWLSLNADKEDVVMANDEVSQLVTIYTPLNVFYHRAAPYSSLSATEERIFEVFFTLYRLRGVGTENAREVFFEEREYIANNIHHLRYRELYGSNEAIPDKEIERILASYEDTLSIPTSKWLQKTWTTYEVEYIVWDKERDSSWQLEQYSFLEEVASFEDIVVYEYRAAE